MGKSSAPSAPNPAAVATATMESGAINQNSPYGSLQYQQTGTNPDGTPIYSENTQLSAPEQGLLTQQQQTQQGLGGAESGLASEIGQPNPALNPANLQGEFGQQQNAAYQQQMGYLQPQEQQQTGQLQDQLANQGITQESDPTAYANAMSLNSNNQTMANQQAYNSSYQTGLAGENQLFNQGVQASNLPISQLGSVMGMANPTTPGFSSTPQNQSYANAAQSAYQGNLASYNNQQQGLFGLGGNGLMAYAMMAGG